MDWKKILGRIAFIAGLLVPGGMVFGPIALKIGAIASAVIAVVQAFTPAVHSSNP